MLASLAVYSLKKENNKYNNNNAIQIHILRS